MAGYSMDFRGRVVAAVKMEGLSRRRDGALWRQLQRGHSVANSVSKRLAVRRLARSAATNRRNSRECGPTA